VESQHLLQSSKDKLTAAINRLVTLMLHGSRGTTFLLLGHIAWERSAIWR